MDKLDQYLIIALLAGYVGKVGVLGASFADAAIVLVLAACYLSFKHLSKHNEITELKQHISSVEKKLDDIKQNHEHLKTDVAGFKITQGYRNVR